MKARKVERGGHAIIHRPLAPDHLHHFLDHEGEPEREQQLGDVAVPVHVAQSVALDQRADAADQHRRDDERRPEADHLADLEAEEGAQHVEAGMGEIEHAHHAEDQREPARHQEQQHAVEHAVKRRYGDELQHPLEPPAEVSSGGSSCSWSERWCPRYRSCPSSSSPSRYSPRRTAGSCRSGRGWRCTSAGRTDDRRRA